MADKMKYHIENRTSKPRIASFVHSSDRDLCLESIKVTQPDCQAFDEPQILLCAKEMANGFEKFMDTIGF